MEIELNRMILKDNDDCKMNDKMFEILGKNLIHIIKYTETKD